MLTAPTATDVERVEAFKQRTQAKLQDVRCPRHRQSPRVQFHGASLREVTVQLSGCCDLLIQLANKAIAS